MEKDKRSKLFYWTVALSLLVSVAMVSLALGQDAPRLEVEVNLSGQVRIFARAVSYGQILRALQNNLGVAIEIPPEADQLKLNYARIEAPQPDEALKKLLEGSGLGYAWLGRRDGTRPEKVVVIASPLQQAKEKTVPGPAPDSLLTRPAGAATIAFASPRVQGERGIPEDQSPPVSPTEARPLSKAGIVNGTEASLAGTGAAAPPINPSPLESQQTVGETPPSAMTRSLSDAAKVVGVPPGVRPEDVGKTKVLPLPPPGQRP